MFLMDVLKFKEINRLKKETDMLISKGMSKYEENGESFSIDRL